MQPNFAPAQETAASLDHPGNEVIAKVDQRESEVRIVLAVSCTSVLGALRDLNHLQLSAI